MDYIRSYPEFRINDAVSFCLLSRFCQITHAIETMGVIQQKLQLNTLSVFLNTSNVRREISRWKESMPRYK